MLKYDKIVIGATLSSVLYSLYQGIPIIFVEHREDHPFDFFEPSVDLSLLKIEPAKYELCTANDQSVTFGIPKQKAYDNVLSILSIGALVPFSDLAKSIWIEDGHIRVVTKGNKTFLVEYNELFIFDDTGINNLPIPIDIDSGKRCVLDWFDVNYGCTHDIDYHETGDEFVKEIFFYNSPERNSRPDRKDLVSISYLTEEQARYDYQYSDTYARFKVLKHMKEAGIRGPKNGKNPNYPHSSAEPFKRLSPRITAAKREIMPPPMATYQDTSKFKFIYETPEEIIANAHHDMDTHCFKLLNALSL
tara:strand:- start:3013 stop:3924 length:912 start_codon:yes stop_codon:yes gene_type:complete